MSSSRRGSTLRSPRVLALVLGIATAAASARAEEPTAADVARQDRIEELERKVEVLTEELASLRAEQAVPEDDGRLQSFSGLGPAFSRIYNVERGLSVGGYAEGFYRHYTTDESDAGDNVDFTDQLRTVLYVGYKFNEHFVFNSEIEFEHATTGSNRDGQSGSVSVEFSALDWLIRDEANLRFGMVLVPMGFVNEIHEPPFFHGVVRPEVETRIIPTTWRENGVGVYGNLAEQLEYRAYVVGGLDGSGITPSDLRNTRSNGNRGRAEDLAGVLRVDWEPPFSEGTLIGGSVYHGAIQQSRNNLPDSRLTLVEGHAQYRRWGLELRGLVAVGFLSDAGELTLARRAGSGSIGPNGTIADRWLGWYLEAAYDLMPWIAPDSEWYLAPFFRYESVDTQYGVPSGFASDGLFDVAILQPGISFKPHPNVVFKLDYRSFDPDQGERADEVQLGFGVAF